MAASAPEPVVENGREQTSRQPLFTLFVPSRMTTALVISLFFHLSMITVFRIVVALPREQVRYYEVCIVSSAAETQEQSPETGAPLTTEALALSGTSVYDTLPEVALPVIEFAELERLRIRYRATESLSDTSELFEDFTPNDSWARFGGELQRFGKTLRELALPDREEPAPTPVPDVQRVLVHRPAEGFEASIEWNGPPLDRELLFSPPLKALWRMNPGELTRPIEIVFTVDSSGRIINVWSPILDDSGVIEEVQKEVLQYRFSPLPSHQADTTETETAAALPEQSGVLFIGRAEDGP